MRVIGGKIGGIRLNPPANLPVRPTTDLAKEALFNILQHQLDWEGCECLDLFCGTGNISYELTSRGVATVDAVDAHGKCLLYVKDVAKRYDLNIKTVRSDVLKFISSCKKQYDFIFADPPYDLPQLPQLPQLIIEGGLLKPQGILVVEHPSTRVLVEHPSFEETRKYGYSSFSFYQNK